MTQSLDFSLVFQGEKTICPAFDKNISELTQDDKEGLESIEATLIMNMPQFHTQAQVESVLRGIISEGYHLQELGSTYLKMPVGAKHDVLIGLVKKFTKV